MTYNICLSIGRDKVHDDRDGSLLWMKRFVYKHDVFLACEFQCLHHTDSTNLHCTSIAALRPGSDSFWTLPENNVHWRLYNTTPVQLRAGQRLKQSPMSTTGTVVMCVPRRPRRAQ